MSQRTPKEVRGGSAQMRRAFDALLDELELREREELLWKQRAVKERERYDRLRDHVQAAVELWDEAHEEDDAIALGAAFVGLRMALKEGL